LAGVKFEVRGCAEKKEIKSRIDWRRIMKSIVTHPLRAQRGSLKGTFKFRIDPKQKNHWEESIAELGLGSDLAAYIRYSVDRSIALDYQTQDPRWQKFLLAVKDKAKEILGYELQDSLQGRGNILNIYANPSKKHKA